LQAGWTSVLQWVVNKDGVNAQPARYFANHLLFEPSNAGRVVIKAHCGWFVIEDPRAEITICNLPTTLTMSGVQTTPNPLLSRADNMAELNHYNQYNRALGTFHRIDFGAIYPSRSTDPQESLVEPVFVVFPTDPDHCFGTVVFP
jgi:hypothetical protein